MHVDHVVEVEFLEGRTEDSLERRPGWLGVGHTDDGRAIFGQVMNADIGIPSFTQRCYAMDEYFELGHMLQMGLLLDYGTTRPRLEVPVDQVRKALHALPRPLDILGVGNRVTLMSATPGRDYDGDGVVTHLGENGDLQIDGRWWFGSDGQQRDGTDREWTVASATPMISGYEGVRSEAEIVSEAEVTVLVDVEFAEGHDGHSLTRRPGWLGLGHTSDDRPVIGEVDRASTGSPTFTDHRRPLGTRRDCEEMVNDGLVLDDGTSGLRLEVPADQMQKLLGSVVHGRGLVVVSADAKQPLSPVDVRAQTLRDAVGEIRAAAAQWNPHNPAMQPQITKYTDLADKLTHTIDTVVGRTGESEADRLERLDQGMAIINQHLIDMGTTRPRSPAPASRTRKAYPPEPAATVPEPDQQREM